MPERIIERYACTYWNLDCAKIVIFQIQWRFYNETDISAKDKAEKERARIS